MLTNNQKQALHSAARLMGPDFSEAMRRSVQWHVGGFHSAADASASRLGFIACMAWYETEAAKLGKQLAATAGYWADELAKAEKGDGLRHRLRAVARRLGWDAATLDRFIAGPRMSRGAAADAQTASTYWLWRAVNALQAMEKRSNG